MHDLFEISNMCMCMCKFNFVIALPDLLDTACPRQGLICKLRFGVSLADNTCQTPCLKASCMYAYGHRTKAGDYTG